MVGGSAMTKPSSVLLLAVGFWMASDQRGAIAQAPPTDVPQWGARHAGRLAQRIKEIEAAKLETPAIFDVIRPYLETPGPRPMARLHNTLVLATGRRPVPPPHYVYGLDVLHQDYRDVVERKPVAYQEYKDALAKKYSLAQTLDGDETTAAQLNQDYEESLQVIAVRHALTIAESKALRIAAGDARGIVSLDPKYTLAWEAALLDVPWERKGHYVRCVAACGDPSSAPILSEVVRVSLQVADRREHEEKYGAVTRQACIALEQHRTAESLVELVDLARDCPGELCDIRDFVRATLANGGWWQQIKELGGRPDYAEYVTAAQTFVAEHRREQEAKKAAGR
jgi:hypothetical protein